MKRLISGSIFLLVWLLAACTTPTATPEPTPAPTAAATATPLSPATPAPVTLTVWLPDWMLLDDPEAAQLLQNAIQSYGIDQNIDIHIVVKPERGPAGLLDALRKTYPVAPAVLPDLIILPFDDAMLAAQENLLQPLNDLITEDLMGDLYPFANNILASGESWYALPFAADFDHLAFQPSALSDIPLSWSTILESNARYAFPAGGPDSTLPDAVLIHYLSASGGSTIRPDAEALRTLLTFYDRLRQQDLLPPDAVQAASAADTWALALQGKADLAHTRASLWLRDRAQATILRFGPIPTADSQPRTIAHGWAFAVVTADPVRKTSAGQFIASLMAPDTLAAWTLAARRLPPRRSALALWPGDEYTLFVGDSLERAIPATALDVSPEFASAVHRAINDVLSGKASIDDAVKAASASWQP